MKFLRGDIPKVIGVGSAPQSLEYFLTVILEYSSAVAVLAWHRLRALQKRGKAGGWLCGFHSGDVTRLGMMSIWRGSV